MITKIKNPWLAHMAQVRKDNPKIKDVVRIGKKSYKK
jgi:hypothetical protein